MKTQGNVPKVAAFASVFALIVFVCALGGLSLAGCSSGNSEQQVVGKWQREYVYQGDSYVSLGYIKGETYTATYEFYEGGTGSYVLIRNKTQDVVEGSNATWEFKSPNIVNITKASGYSEATYGYKLSSDGGQMVSVEDSNKILEKIS